MVVFSFECSQDCTMGVKDRRAQIDVNGAMEVSGFGVVRNQLC